MTICVIFTDLDGTLLDPVTYSCQVAAPAVARLNELGIPLVFCSSKTYVEQVVYRQALNVAAPFIVENGSAIYIPKGYFTFNYLCHRTTAAYDVIELGTPVGRIRQVLTDLRRRLNLPFATYADLSLSDIAAITGLDTAAADRARQREYSETILQLEISPQAAVFQQFKEALAQHGLDCIEGSKFYTVMGAGSDKGRAVSLLSELFRRQHGDITTIALGDAPNDEPMLATVDKAFLVQKPGDQSVASGAAAGPWAAIDLPHLQRVEGIGPEGWRLVVTALAGSSPKPLLQTQNTT